VGGGWARRGCSWLVPGFPQSPQHPASGISWHDAKEFCRWLSKVEQTEGFLTSSQIYRLPTDIEWSAAVGLGSEQGSIPSERGSLGFGPFPWGKEWPPTQAVGNYADQDSGILRVLEEYCDPFPCAAPVGSFPPNRFGFYDLGGNVWEWCEDWYDSDERFKTMRGGSWLSAEKEVMRATHRDRDPPGLRNINFGFRVVLATEK
jgi:formylglycine-generating enzyme required for sulfatase activity